MLIITLAPAASLVLLSRCFATFWGGFCELYWIDILKLYEFSLYFWLGFTSSDFEILRRTNYWSEAWSQEIHQYGIAKSPPHPLQRCFYSLMRPGKVQTPNMALQHIQYRQFPCGILSSIHLHCCTSIFLHLFSIFPGEIHRWTPGCDHRWFCSWMAGARTWDMSTDAAGYPTQAEHVKERDESSHANASPGGLGVSWESHESLIGA